MAFNMMDATTYIMITTALTWLVWDIVLCVKRQKDPRVSTISMILTSFSWYSPALQLVAGILMGHWFWPA